MSVGPAGAANDLAWDDLPVGAERSVTTPVTREDVAEFARLSGDHSPIHVDEAAAREMGFVGVVAHGALIAARVSAVIGMQLPGRRGVLQSLDLQFRHPLIPPADIQITVIVAGRSDAVRQLRLQVTVTDASGTVLVSGKASSIVR